MKIQTMSIVVGTTACNASCPFCVSKTTPEQGIVPQVNIRNFEKVAVPLAHMAGCTTILFTGKGEPTLYPNQITQYLNSLNKLSDSAPHIVIPFKELQTNGIEISKWSEDHLDSTLQTWYELGLTTICLSIVHWNRTCNSSIYTNGDADKHYRLASLIDKLHKIGFSVRLSVMMLKGYIDYPIEVQLMINVAKENAVEQLTIRPISYPQNDESETTKWIKKYTLGDKQMCEIREFIEKRANKVLTLPHGAEVYDFEGQNICLSDCLTSSEDEDHMRQIIFFPDGRIGYDWRYEGARLL